MNPHINELLDTKIQEATDTFMHLCATPGILQLPTRIDSLTENNNLELPCSSKKINKTDTVVAPPITDIDLFYIDTSNDEPEDAQPDKRTQNGNINDRRENVLVFIANRRELPGEYAQDSRWIHLHTELHKVLSAYVVSTCSMDWSGCFVKKAGRKYNYDFEFTNELGVVVKYEFKYCIHNPRIDALPQIYQGACSSTNIFNDGFSTFDEYYYENGLSNYCKIDSPTNEPNPLPLIDKPTYLKHVKCATSSHLFFVQLKSQYSKNVDEKNAVVNHSIEEYLKQCHAYVNLDAVSELLQKQKDKTYLMWHPKTRQFYTEQIPEHELTITRVSHITKNTIVFVAATYSYCFLLRWKNRKGILNPAWQVSVKI